MSTHDAPADAPAESVRTRSERFNDLAHELRGAAGVILGALQELEFALGDDVVKHQAMLAMAKRGVTRITRAADQLQQTDQREHPTTLGS